MRLDEERPLDIDDGWQRFVDALADVAARFDGQIHVEGGMAVLSSSVPIRGDGASSIRIRKFDDDSARIEAGWCFALLAEYTGDGHHAPALEVVNAICSGNAAEHCLLDSDGSWVGILAEAWTTAGNSWQAGNFDHSGRRITHRFPAWVSASA